MQSFSGFSPADFDAYQPHKWQSNVFNLERLQVKQKLAALGRQLNPTLLASDGSLLELAVSAEHPALWNQRRVECQHLFFSRNQEACRELDRFISKQRSMASLIEDPSPLRNHIFLGIMLDAEKVELALKLHSDASVDRENLQRKCHDFFQRDKLLQTIQALPEGLFEIGIIGEPMTPAGELDDERLQALIEQLGSADSWLAICRTFQRDDAALASSDFVEVAGETLQQLLSVLHQVAWSRDNDFLSMRETLRDQQVRQKSKGLAKNDRVRVVRGFFSGKVGVVQSVDAKGGLKVTIGKMSVKLSGEDVTKA